MAASKLTNNAELTPTASWVAFKNLVRPTETKPPWVTPAWQDGIGHAKYPVANELLYQFNKLFLNMLKVYSYVYSFNC